MIYRGKNNRLDKDKTLYRLVAESDRLWQASRDAPIVPLEKPYQRGWTRTYKLRDDVSRRREAPFIQYALNLVNDIQLVKDKDNPPVDRYGNEIHLQLKIITEKQFAGMNLPQGVVKWMSLGYHYRHWSNRPTYGWTFSAPDHFIVYDYQPNIITHTRVTLPDVETRLAEVRSQMQRFGGWDRYNKLKGRRKCRDDYRKTDDPKNFHIEQLIED